jgi:hypothetical protein
VEAHGSFGFVPGQKSCILRIPSGQAECVFRPMWPPVPVESGHLFRRNAAACGREIESGEERHWTGSQLVEVFGVSGSLVES